MALPTLRPLSFGEILDGAFTLYRRNFVTFAGTALIPTAAMVVAFLVLGGGFVAAMTSAGGTPAERLGQAMSGFFLVMLVGLAGGLVMWGALTHQASQAYTGHATSVGDGFRTGGRAALPLLGTVLLAWIALVVAAVGVGIVLMIVMFAFAAAGGAAAVIGAALVFVGWIVFALAAFSMLFAVAPAVVVEGAGPLQALERSFTLARGALGRVIGLLLVTLLITYLPMIAVLALTGGFTAMMNPQAVPSAGQFITQQVLSMGVGVLTTPFMVSVIVLLYFDRRVRTEALDVQMMTDRLAVAGD
jgi:hypothetical protein